jgi:hypothetical protein
MIIRIAGYQVPAPSMKIEPRILAHVRGGRKVKHVAVEKCNTWYEVIGFSFQCPYLAAE